MILRDARGQRIDLGARQVWEPSQMKMIGGMESTGSGQWARDMAFLFKRVKKAPVERPLRVVKVKVTRVTAPKVKLAARPRTARLPAETVAAKRLAYQAAYRAARRAARPIGHCVECGAELPASSPRDRKYCSIRCRGRWERQHANR